MKVNSSRQTVQKTVHDEDQEKIYHHKEAQAYLKEIMGKINDLFEEFCMDIETEYRCT